MNVFNFRTNSVQNDIKNTGEKGNRNSIVSNHSKSNDLPNPPAIRQSLGPNTATIYSKSSSLHKNSSKQNQENPRRVKITT